MKLIVLVITLITVAAGSARATEMVEVPNPPPFMPRQPTLLEKKNDEAKGLLFGGLVLIAAGLGIEAGAVVYAVDNPCVLPLACLFGPSHGDEIVSFAALGFSGLVAVGGGITLTAIGGAKLSKLHRKPVSLRLTGRGVSLSGRF